MNRDQYLLLAGALVVGYLLGVQVGRQAQADSSRSTTAEHELLKQLSGDTEPSQTGDLSGGAGS